MASHGNLTIHTCLCHSDHEQFIFGLRIRDLKASVFRDRDDSRHELTGERDWRWERRVTFVSDFRLLELARFRLGRFGDSGDSNGLFVLVPFVVLLVKGRSSVDD
jgi:hypothetical protein